MPQDSRLTDQITVVLLTHNSGTRLPKIISSLKKYAEDAPILAVDNASDDDTLELLRRHDITVVALPQNIGAAARNIGVMYAQTPYIAFCDDDIYWEKGSLAKAIQYFEAYPDLTLINAKILIGKEGQEDAISKEMSASPLPSGDLPGHTLLSFLGGASAVRRHAFLDAGGYEPRLFLGGEEELLATEMVLQGAQLRYLPDVQIRHFPDGAHAEEFRPYGVRNALWFVWRRRSVRHAWQWSLHIYKTAGVWCFLKGLAGFLTGLPWVIRTRQAVPDKLERQLEILDKQRLGASTRDYSGD